MRSPLLRGSGIAFFLKILGLGLAFASQIIIARVLKDEEFGKYVYTISWIQLLLIPAAAGFPQAAVRLVPTFLASATAGSVTRYLRASSIMTLVASLLVAGVFCAVLFALPEDVDPALRNTLYAGAPLLIILAQAQLRSEALRGFKRLVASLFPLLVLRPAMIGIGVIALNLMLLQPLTGANALAVNAGSSLIVFLMMEFFLRRARTGIGDHSRGTKAEYRSWIAIAFPLMLLGVFNVFLARTDILLIGALVGTKEAGWYSAANQIASLAALGLQSINVILAPMIADSFSRADDQQVQRIVKRGAQLGFLVTLPAVLIIAVFGERLLGMYGSNFVVARPALLILVVGQTVNALAGSVGFLLTMTNREGTASRIVGLAALINVALNIPFILFWGIEGAAAATAVSVAFWNFSMIYVARKRLGINPTIFSRHMFSRQR